LRQLAEIYRTHLVYPAAICSQSCILARGDDCSAPCTDLAGGMRLVVFRIEVLQLSILAIVLHHLALGHVLAILRQDTASDCCLRRSSSPYSGIMLIMPPVSAIAGRFPGTPV